MLFKNPVQILIYLAMMVYVSWELTIFVLVFLPIAGTVMGKVGKRSNARRVWRSRYWGDILSTTRRHLRAARYQGVQCRR